MFNILYSPVVDGHPYDLAKFEYTIILDILFTYILERKMVQWGKEVAGTIQVHPDSVHMKMNLSIVVPPCYMMLECTMR